MVFAVWITGLPASGKSTLAAELRSQFEAMGLDVAVLESDVFRRVFTPEASYQAEDRDLFYRQFTYVGVLLAQHGVPVIFDATANLRRYRDEARRQIPDFCEVFVDCPLDICMQRDPKQIYKKAREIGASTVPGLHATYEPPLQPEVKTSGGQESIQQSATRIVATLRDKGFISAQEPGPYR